MPKLSIVIPFRDREVHLRQLVPQLRKYQKHNDLDLEIIVVEQDDAEALRRGALRNEGVRVATGEVIVLHDVDYLPEMDTVYWTEDADVFRAVNQVHFVNMDGSLREEHDIPSGYRTFSKSIDDNFYGGVLCIRKDKFVGINGYNPMFEGWGLEDDEIRERIRKNNLRVVSGNGLFKALPHPDSFKNDMLFRRNQWIFHNRQQFNQIGMNCGALRVQHNTTKADSFDVDIWLDVSGWNIPELVNTKVDHIHELDYGKFMTLDNVSNDHVQRAVVNGQRWEPEVMALCEKYVQPNTTVVDIGANMGTFTVRLAQLVGKNGKVVAFEPQRIIYQQLCGNIFLNKLRNVFAFNMAISNCESDVTLTPIDYDNGAPGEVRIDGNNGEVVQCTSLDAFNLFNVSLIKMDVERWEPFVFDGARKTIEQNRPVILFELTTLPLPDFPPDFVLQLLTDLNYHVYQISEWGDYLGIPAEKDDNT